MMDQDIFQLLNSPNGPMPMEDASVDHSITDPDVLLFVAPSGHPLWSDPNLTYPQTNGYTDETTLGSTNTASFLGNEHVLPSQPAGGHNCVNRQPAALYPTNDGSATGPHTLHHSQSVPNQTCFNASSVIATPLGQPALMNHFIVPQAHCSQPMNIIGNSTGGEVNTAHQNRSSHSQMSSSYPHCSPEEATAMANGFTNNSGSPQEHFLMHNGTFPPTLSSSIPNTSKEGTSPPTQDSTGTSPGTQGNARVGNQKKSEDKKGGLWIFTVFWMLLMKHDPRIKWISKLHFIFQVEENQTEAVSHEWAKGGYVATWGNFTRAIRESIGKNEGFLIKIDKDNPPCVIPKNRVFQFGDKAREKICEEDPEFQALATQAFASADQLRDEPCLTAPPRSESSPSLTHLSPWNVEYQD